MAYTTTHLKCAECGLLKPNKRFRKLMLEGQETPICTSCNWRDDRGVVKLDHKNKCLRCDKMFNAVSVYNRICPTCKESNAWKML